MKKIVLFLMILFLIPSAYAGSITTIADFNDTGGGDVSLYESVEDVFFDPSLGHLNSVQMKITAEFGGTYNALAYTNTYGEINEPYFSSADLIFGATDVYRSPEFTISGHIYAPAEVRVLPFYRDVNILNIEFEHSITETDTSVLEKFMTPPQEGTVAFAFDPILPDGIYDDLGIPYVPIDYWSYGVVQFTYSYSVPEPAIILLLGTGLLGVAGFRRKFKKFNVERPVTQPTPHLG